ncbi:MAG TPA: YhzD family protein [Pseudogracilibacillus sp.]|nr:YhzD family protein [Pseudogracilibacillus sp.]
MSTYYLTAFSDKGETLLDTTIDAQNDVEGKRLAQQTLQKENLDQTTHRLVTSDATLLLFHR